MTTAGGIANGTNSFTVTPTQYPYYQQGGKLVGTGAIGFAEQGRSVTLSADGSTAVVVGPYDNNDTGAIWVFTRSGASWTQQGNKLIGTGASGEPNQGYSVSLSADGNTVLLGGPGDNNGTGAVWVFTRSGNAWSQQGNKLVGTGADRAGHGTSVSLSADGNTAIFGGPGDDSSAGAVWIYTRSGNTWVQQGSKLVGTGAIGAAEQGAAVYLSADGGTAIVAGPEDDSGKGAIWIYSWSGGTWVQQGSKLVGSLDSNYSSANQQGKSVSLSADGNTAIVGEYNYVGGALVFIRTGTIWRQQGEILVGSGYVGNPQEGWSVSLSADGNVAILGGNQDSEYNGAAWVFTRIDTTWTQQGGKIVGSGISGHSLQGWSVSISSDGSTAIVGGVGDGTQGAAWVYSSTPTGIEDIPSAHGVIRLYPNPNTGTFTLETTQVEGATYTISDMLGRIIQHEAIISDSQNIAVGAVPAGIYMLSISGISEVMKFALIR